MRTVAFVIFCESVLCCVVLCSACLGPFQCSMLKRTHLPLQLSQSCLCFRQCLFTLREDFCRRSSVRWPREQTITIENEASSQRARQKQKTFGRNDNTKDNWNKENSSGVFFSVVVILFSTNTSILARNGRICCNEECLVDIERFFGVERKNGQTRCGNLIRTWWRHKFYFSIRGIRRRQCVRQLRRLT